MPAADQPDADDRPAAAPDVQRPAGASGPGTGAGHEEGLPLVPLRDAPPAVRLKPHHTREHPDRDRGAEPVRARARRRPGSAARRARRRAPSRPAAAPSTRAVTSAHSAQAPARRSSPVLEEAVRQRDRQRDRQHRHGGRLRQRGLHRVRDPSPASSQVACSGGRLAQLVRALALQARGPRFEPGPPIAERPCPLGIRDSGGCCVSHQRDGW